MLYLVLITISFLISWVGTALLQRVLLKKAIMDLPNDRSLHKAPVPRGGGLAVVGTIVLLMIAGSAWHNAWNQSLYLIAPLLVLMTVSWLDDRGGVAPAIRLTVHVLAALTASFAFSPSLTIFDGALPFWLDRLLMIMGWAWFMNLYNFMDGIDGITGTETIVIGIGIIGVMLLVNQPDIQTIETRIGIYAAMLAGAAAGFLMLNWHPAKIFLGDIGSVPLGFLTGYVLLAVALHFSLPAALILPLYYLADSGITLAKRLLSGQKVWQAHRQHFYQQAALAIGRHDKVVGWILGGNMLLLVCALGAVYAPLAGLGAAVVTVAALLYQLHRLSRPRS